MRLYNYTRYNLKDFFLAKLKANGVDHKEYAIHVSYSRRNKTWGCAFYHKLWSVRIGKKKLLLKGKRFIRLTVPKEKIDYNELAKTFDHEIGHTRGLKHKDMIDHWKLTPTWHLQF